MVNYNPKSENSKYYLPKHTYLHVVHWALQYEDWAEQLKILPDSSKAITYDKERVQTSFNDYDPTQDLAIRRAEISRKMKILEDTVREVDDSIYKYLLLSVGYGKTEYQLKDMGMPCGHQYFSKRRQQIYYSLAQKI